MNDEVTIDTEYSYECILENGEDGKALLSIECELGAFLPGDLVKVTITRLGESK